MTKQEYINAKVLNLTDFIINKEESLTDGTITGRNKIASVQRQIEAANKTYKATVNAKGNFSCKLPAPNT
jgi:hypothetical protein